MSAKTITRDEFNDLSSSLSAMRTAQDALKDSQEELLQKNINDHYALVTEQHALQELNHAHEKMAILQQETNKELENKVDLDHLIEELDFIKTQLVPKMLENEQVETTNKSKPTQLGGVNPIKRDEVNKAKGMSA